MAWYAEATPVSSYSHLLYKRDTDDTTEEDKGDDENILDTIEDEAKKDIDYLAGKTGMEPW